MRTDLLKLLVACHSTPGDEDEVISLLSQEWCRYPDWACRSLGRYAFLAERASEKAFSGEKILLCAHADSPGFIVDSLRGGYGTAVPLGGPHFEGKQTAAIVKTKKRKIPIVLRKISNENDKETSFRFKAHSDICCGDRVAYAPNFRSLQGGDFLRAPFFDNRAGCFLLCDLLSKLPQATAGKVVVAVTAAEEFTGFGASVLARHIDATLVICLDTTYVSSEQRVDLGNGPVLTLADKSVLTASETQAVLRENCQKWGIPLQSEVYNFSGTDARAFPMAGCLAPVLPLLIPSEGNHTPQETIASKDLEYTLQLLLKICTDTDFITQLRQKAFTWSIRG